MENIQVDPPTPVADQTRRRISWPWLVALIFGLGLVALWSVVLLGLVPRLPAEGSPEVTFARDMAAHHTQAVEMALILRDRSNDEELRRFALDILLTQQAQIGQMDGWLAAWGLPLSGLQPPMSGMGEMMGMATRKQINELQTLAVSNAEVSFLQLMIRHHQGGVIMAQAALRQTNRPEVVRLATAIVAGQQSEIDYMTDLLARRGAEPLPPLEPMPMNHDGS
jgi:uncharacterized protein (DUF305 family)